MKNILTLSLILIMGCTELPEKETAPAAPETSLILDVDKLADYLVELIADKHNTAIHKVRITLDFNAQYQQGDPGVMGIYDFPNHLYCEQVTLGRIVIEDLEAEVE